MCKSVCCQNTDLRTLDIQLNEYLSSINIVYYAKGPCFHHSDTDSYNTDSGKAYKVDSSSSSIYL